MSQNLIPDQNKNQCNNKKSELKLENLKSNKDVKNGELKLEISEEEYLKSKDYIKNEYTKCTNNNCSNPSFYHLRKKIFYIDSKKINYFVVLVLNLG